MVKNTKAAKAKFAELETLFAHKEQQIAELKAQIHIHKTQESNELAYYRGKLEARIYSKTCFKCQSLGHYSNECNLPEVCGKCANNHKTKDCTSKKIKCINCVRQNECICDPSEYNNEKDHYAFRNCCPAYQYRLQEIREEEISAEETKKQNKQQKQVTPTQEDLQQIC
ncbi:hypothetical protein CEXT_650321 [Caerostris extrusa]|uniref:CCHC-type domain-containing protein n=1 Tax=Caerostris extrusa TaxID=172846 RepID=A0AAV4MY12_CAEEX|nr:hypothetical protein CEXT_650321 [Caerostris extrusa]